MRFPRITKSDRFMNDILGKCDERILAKEKQLGRKLKESEIRFEVSIVLNDLTGYITNRIIYEGRKKSGQD